MLLHVDYLLISSLPGWALKTSVKMLGTHCDSTSVFKALPSKLDIKRHEPSIVYLCCVHASS